MKKFIFSLIIPVYFGITLPVAAQAQNLSTIEDKISSIVILDSLIQDFSIRNNLTQISPMPAPTAPPNSNAANERKSGNVFRQDMIAYVKQHLFPLLEIEIKLNSDFNEAVFKYYLDRIRSTETITWLELTLVEEIEAQEISLDAQTFHNFSINSATNTSFYKRVHKLVVERMNDIIKTDFTNYSFTEESSKRLKFIYVEHRNDFFSLYNDDRDMTGAFRFEFGTDLFKLRLMRNFKQWIPSLNGRSIFSYQSFFIGSEGYTPYLRDSVIFNKPESFDPDDRPYASFLYIGRAKYRINARGTFRMLAEFKLGMIGSEDPGKVQSLIHRDITIGSYKPNGWQAQIASGGRLALNINYEPEFMLFSKNWLINRKITNNTREKLHERRKIRDAQANGNFGDELWNVSLPVELKYGHDLTALGVGLRLSTINFKKSGAFNFRNMTKHSDKWWQHILKRNAIVLDGKIAYRRVIHNSMLEGYGIVKHNIDEDASSPKDVHFIQPKQINRNLFIAEFAVILKMKYGGLVFKQQYMSPEYDMPVNTKIYPNSDKRGVPGKHNKSPWNHVGTLGFYLNVGK